LKNKAVSGHRQLGFTRGKSCSTHLVSFYDEVTCVVDQGKPADVVAWGFSKAFDAVSHSILPGRLSSAQLDMSLRRRVGNWLMGQAQRGCHKNGVTSGWQPVTGVVPQGSILGLMLFNVVINDLEAGIKRPLSKFANDTKLGGAVDSLKGRETLIIESQNH